MMITEKIEHNIQGKKLKQVPFMHCTYIYRRSLDKSFRDSIQMDREQWTQHELVFFAYESIHFWNHALGNGNRFYYITYAVKHIPYRNMVDSWTQYQKQVSKSLAKVQIILRISCSVLV